MPNSDDTRYELRPRLGAGGTRNRQERVPRFRQFVLLRAQQRFSRLVSPRPDAKPPHFGGAGATADVPRPARDARRCVIKAHVNPLSRSGLAAARKHLAYIEREGVEQDGSPGRLYYRDGSDLREALTKPLPGERHQFRFIVSPEDAHRADLTAFARDLMAQVERDTGRRLIWGAVNHHDTDNPHVHIVVRGVDAAGQQVRLERAYISERMRWQAQHLLTKELGVRTELDMTRQLGREVRQERFTSIDQRLARLLTPARVLDLRRLALTTDGATRARSMARLAVLENLGLAERSGPRTWQLVEGWELALRGLGERGDVIKRIHGALAGRGDPARYVVLDGRAPGPPVEGVVRRKGLHDELRGEQYAVVETPRGQAYYVRLDGHVAEQVHEGAIVLVEQSLERWAKRADRVIERVAAAAGGVYDPARHLESLRKKPISIAGQPVDPASVIEVNVRRLKRLERYGLATRRADGAWIVPTDLVATLERREQTHPRLSTKLEVVAPPLAHQLKALEPTWLDSQPLGDPSRAAYGFGAELAAARREREAHVAQLGLRTPTALQAHEDLVFAQRAAAGVNCELVRDVPAAFRGRLEVCDDPVSGRPFARVVDEGARRVVVLPMSTALQRLDGQLVSVTRDPAGRPVAQPIGRRLDHD